MQAYRHIKWGSFDSSRWENILMVPSVFRYTQVGLKIVFVLVCTSYRLFLNQDGEKVNLDKIEWIIGPIVSHASHSFTPYRLHWWWSYLFKSGHPWVSISSLIFFAQSFFFAIDQGIWPGKVPHHFWGIFHATLKKKYFNVHFKSQNYCIIIA